jgi:hypothetical protein
MVILCDEIFTLGQPILLTVEPRSLAILKIELVEKRDAETWQKHWEELVKAGLITNPLVVSDQGSGLVKGCELMGLTHHPDLFHLLQLLSGFEGRFYRQALKAISLEYERARVFESAKSARVIEERMRAYERAKAKAQKAIERFDNFSYLWRELRAALELFDSQGRLKPGAAREAEIKAILELMSQLGDEKLSAAVKSFAAGLEGYWDYYRRVEQRYQEWLKRYPAEFSDAVYGGSVRKLTDMEAYSAADNIPSSDPEVALFLAITTQAINAKRALEIGGTLPVNSSAAPESSRAPNLRRPKLSMPCHGLAARSIWLTLTR